MKLPIRRKELIKYIGDLSDPTHQRESWVEGNLPPGRMIDDFDCVVHFFFDDTPLADHPETQIGMMLKDEMEVALVKELVAALDAVLENNDFGLTDEEYIATPEWKTVVEVAKRALPVFTEGEGEDLDTAPA